VHFRRFLPLTLIALLLVVVTAALGLGVRPGAQEPGDEAERFGTLGSTPAPFRQPPASDSHLGFAFPTTLSRPPTADEGQSKLWIHDGSWWGVLIDPDTDGWHIHRLDARAQTWTNTGVMIDERPESRADVLSDGDRLYVATGGASPDAGEHVRLMRFSYDSESNSYSLDPGFPVQLTDTGVKRLAIAKDGIGILWITYALDGRVWMSHSISDHRSWAAPSVLPVEGASAAAEQAVIVAYGDGVGVAWTSSVDATVYFASHADGDPPHAWSVASTSLEGGLPADDHIEVGALPGPDGGTVFVVVKTSLDTLTDSQPSDPQLVLLEVSPNGEWTSHVAGVLRDRHTQPVLLIDEDARELYLFAVAPFGEGVVYYKRTPADEIALPPGLGTPFLAWPDGPQITTPTSTKQNVGATSDLVVLASDAATNRYVHGTLDLSGAAAP
jgi:hypothetical protein